MCLIIGISIYKLKFPQKKLNYGLLVILFSILPIVSILRPGDYNGQLFQNAEFAAGFWNSLSEGHIIPTWAANLDSRFGYAAFIFLYPLPFYLISLIHLLGISFMFSIKAVFLLSYLAAGWAMWSWTKTKFKPSVAWFVTILYQFAPYRFIDMHFRLDIGESISFVWLPLVFLFGPNNWVLGGIFIAALILSHPAVSLIGIALAVLYYRRKILRSLIFGLSLSAYYWMPVIFESGFVHESSYLSQKFVMFLGLKDLLYSPWRWGFLFQGSNGELALIIGYATIIVILLSFLLLKNRIYKSEIVFWLITSLVLIFMMLGISEPLWKIIPFIGNFQFSYRLLAILSFTTAMLGGIVCTLFPQKWRGYLIIVLAIVAVFSTILNWANREANPHTTSDGYIQEYLSKQPQDWLSFPAAFPIWMDYFDMIKEKSVVVAPIDVVSGQANIAVVKRTSVDHIYKIEVQKDSLLRENTSYYPGWTLLINGKPGSIDYTNGDFPGVMYFNLERGLYNVEFKFVQTEDRILSRFVSAVAVACGLLFF